MKDLIEEVKASMQSNRQRIMLTGFAIGWGMFILVTLLGSAGGIQKGVYKGANLDMSQLIALTTGKTSIPWNGMNTDRMVEMTLEDANALYNQHLDYVVNVYPTFSQAVQAVSGSEYVNTSLTGCTLLHNIIRSFAGVTSTILILRSSVKSVCFPAVCVARCLVRIIL